MRNLDMNGSANGVGHDPVSSSSESIPEPIAIIGLALRLPGKIHTTESFWDLLINGKETSGSVPSSRYNAAGFYSASKRPGTIGVQRGHFLDESDGLDRLDTSFFSMGAAEVAKLDPQQRMLLEVVWECMENAGQANGGWRGTNTGVFVGTWGDDWQDFLAKDPQQTGGMLNVSGAGDFAISNRISYEYNLTGPSMTIKAACASSMISLHEACQSLREGGCSAAIVAGTNLILTPTQTIAQTEAGVLSPTGQCRTFDASANGYARGEAINALLVKRLSDAVRDQDPIRAVIRATAVNCDGASAGISAPNPVAHEKMIRRAYEVAQLSPSDTPFVEAHGTGTPSGDPLELRGLAAVFGGEKETYVGSVKANVGHGEGASSVTSIIKAVLMLENYTIPPQVNFSTPNPNIPFKQARLVVPTEVTPWPPGRPQRISVNSFGITGANAHAIIESAASFAVVRSQYSGPDDLSVPNLLLISANTAGSLKRRADQTQDYVEAHPDRAYDLAYTLASRREHLTHRAFCLSSQRGATFPSERVKQTPKINLVFTGQGAQWPAMGKELIEKFPQFKDDLVRMSDALSRLPHPPPWDLIEELLKPEPKSRVNEAQFSQPLCTAIQIALVNLIVSTFGILPSAVVGHSSGEIAAAYAAGAITADEAIAIAYYRGRIAVTSTKPRTGAMAAVGMGRAEASLYLERDVVVACDNSPNSVTLSGDEKTLAAVVDQMKSDDKDVFVRLLKTDGMAYHSRHMAELGPAYERHLQPCLKVRPTTITFFSTVTGKKVPGDIILDAGYWRRNLESPVKFFPAVKALLASQQPADQLFLEIGPHSALSGPLRQIFKTTATKGRLTYLPSLVRGKDAVESILEMCGQLYLHTVPVQLEALTPGGTTLTDLPPYPWQHESSHWTESRAVRAWRTRAFPPHELLGSRILEGNDIEPTWRNLLCLKDSPWLVDHKVLSDVVFPCAGYIAMAGEAVRQITGANDFSLCRFSIQTAMILTDDNTVEVVTSFKPSKYSTTGWYDFTIYSHNGNAWTKHCEGQARAGKDTSIAEFRLADIEDFARDVRNPYSVFTRVGIHYGPTFQGLQAVSARPGHRTATASLQSPPETDSHYSLHPTTIDNCLQLLGLAAADGLAHHFEEILLPTGIDSLYINTAASEQEHSQPVMKARAAATPVGDDNSSGDIQGTMTVVADGSILLAAQGCKLSKFEQQDSGLDRDERIAAARLYWRPDLDFTPLHELMVSHVKDLNALRLMETYVLLSALAIQSRVRQNAPYDGHWEKFRLWIDAFVEEGRVGQNSLVENSSELVQLNEEALLALLQTVQSQVSDPEFEFAAVAELVTRLVDNAIQVFTGETQILDVYLRDDGLTKLYALTGDRIDSSEFFITAGHTNPTMRILEIGAGTGGTTLLALQALTSINDEPMYSNYTFTDVSSGFFSAAKERFDGYSGLEFKTLDISQDPLEQGFEAASYDLIIASNVIHATETLNVTLRNVRKLLHPRGRFFLQELTPAAAKMINLIMGPLPGWWLGEADGRASEPIVSPERWDAELRDAGFDGIECLVHDDPNTRDHLGVNMVAKPATSLRPEFPTVTLLLRESQAASSSVELLVDTLGAQGYHVDMCFLPVDIDQNTECELYLPVYQDIISLLEVDEPFIDNITPQGFALLQQLINHLVSGSSKLLWVIRSAQTQSVADPAFGLTLGLMRSIRAELSPSIATLEVDNISSAASEAIIKVFEKFQDPASVSSGNSEYEYILRDDGMVYVGRYHWTSASREIAKAQENTSTYPYSYQLNLEARAGPKSKSKSLEWTPHPPTLTDLHMNDVQITPAHADIQGQAGSGTITAVGSAVHKLSIGDRVMFLLGKGSSSLSTSIIVSVDQAVKIPDALTLQDAAGMPLTFATALYSLVTVSNVRQGQTVLVHNAAGGVGQAAVQVCRMLGAEILATVDRPDEMEDLARVWNIPRTHIFSSSNGSVPHALTNATGKRDVDVVLVDSSAGELVKSLWKCMAPRGKMVILGGTNLRTLDIDLFEGNKSLTCVDMATLQDLYADLLGETIRLYKEGHIKPITPAAVIPGDKTEEISSILNQTPDQRAGTTIVQIPHASTIPKTLPAPSNLKLRTDAAYLLVGGLGGLGQSVSTYLVEHGARHLIYLSRSAGSSPRHERFFAELKSQGCSVSIIKADVSDPQAVRTALAESQAERPIAGVLHMAMVLNDRPFLSMSHDEWSTALKPKVNGTWNLHETLLEIQGQGQGQLDFFVIFGSVSGSFGIAHQANYAAANTFQDAFVHYRHGLGLPASVLNIGAMADVGYVSENKSVEEYFRGAGMPFLDEGDFFHALHQSISHQLPSSTLNTVNENENENKKKGISNKSHLTLGLRSTKPTSDPSNRVLWKHDRRADIYLNVEAARLQQDPGSGGVNGSEDKLSTFMTAVRARSTPSILDDPGTLPLLTHEIGVHIYELMLRPVEELDVSKALVTLGVDSLVIVEIRAWLRRRLEVEASTLEILNGGTIEMLGRVCVERLRVKYSSSAS